MKVICESGILQCSEIDFLGDTLNCSGIWFIPINEVIRIEEDNLDEEEE